jgi:hypothetical protein
MRFANPDGVLGLRSATLRVIPFWSGFGERFNTRSLPYRSAKQANSAKMGDFKTPDARTALSLLVSIPASSFRPKRGFPSTACGMGETVSQRACPQGMSGAVSEWRPKMT